MTFRALFATALVAGLAAPAHAELVFDFDTDAQGWTVQDGGAVAYRSSGGVTGGFLEFTDLDDRDMLAVWQPGGADWSVYAAGVISFDARILSPNPPNWSGFGEVSLSGPGGSVAVDVVPADLPLADGSWQHFSVPMAAFGSSLPGALAHVQALRIKTEYSISTIGVPDSFEVLGLDNVVISAVPEAPAWALLLAGALLLPALQRRRSPAPE